MRKGDVLQCHIPDKRNDYILTDRNPQHFDDIRQMTTTQEAPYGKYFSTQFNILYACKLNIFLLNTEYDYNVLLVFYTYLS